MLATTDDPLDDLAHHAALRRSDIQTGDPSDVPARPVPRPGRRAVRGNVAALLAGHRPAAPRFAGYLAALEERRAHFVRHGAVSTDHGVQELFTADLDAADAARLFEQVSPEQRMPRSGACSAGTCCSRWRA